MLKESFRFGDWQVTPAANSLQRGSITNQIEPRLMEVLATLCYRANDVVSTEELLQQCWGGTLYGDNPVHKTIAQLRRVLGDSAADARYIETIRKRGYRAIAHVLPQQGQAGTAAGSWTDGSPFRGLQSFEAEHAPVFFGRAEATAKLLEAVHKQASTPCAFVLVLGSSGSGKSSLVRAGALPNLRKEGGHEGMRVAACTTLNLASIGGHQAMACLGEALLVWQVNGRPIFADQHGEALGQRLSNSISTVIAEIRWALARLTSGIQRLALFVDQLETLFSSPDLTGTARQAFLNTLDALARSGHVLVIAACRNDFYPRLVTYPLLMEGKSFGSHFDLAPPSAAEIIQMIRLPAKAANLTFGTDTLTQSRLDDLLAAAASRSPDALPLLQYALQALYETRTAYDELSIEAFHRLGGIEGAIGKRAEAVLLSLGKPEQDALPRVLSLLVTLSFDEELIGSRRALRSALRGEAERKLVDALVESRLLVGELWSGQAVFGVAHEALLRHWTRVTDWIDQHRAQLRTRARVASAASRWAGDSRRADLLLPDGAQLNEAQQLLDAGTITLSQDEVDLICASRRRVAMRLRLRISVLVSIVVLALCVGLLGALAARASRIAHAQQTQAEGLMEYMLGDFADKVRPLGRLDLLDGISGKALQYLSGSTNTPLDQTSLNQRAHALEIIAEVRLARADPKGALDALQAGRAILLQQITHQPNDAVILKNLGTNSFWLGQIHADQSAWPAAESYFTQYLAYSNRRSALQPNDVDGWIEQSYARNSLGTMMLKRGDGRRAAIEFQASVALKVRAKAQRPDDKPLAAELADSLSWLALAKQEVGELQTAAALYQQERDTLQALVAAEPSEALWQYRLGLAIQHEARLQAALGQAPAALQGLRQAGALLDPLIAKQPDNRSWLKDRIYMMLDEQSLTLSLTGTDIASLATNIAKLESLTARYPDNALWSRLKGIAYSEQALSAQQAGRAGEALQHAVRSANLLQHLSDRNPTDLRTQEALANTLLIQAQLQDAGGQIEEAANSCHRAREALQQVARTSQDYQVLDPWARANICYGDAEAASNAKTRLAAMGYQDRRYLNSISTPYLKGRVK